MKFYYKIKIFAKKCSLATLCGWNEIIFLNAYHNLSVGAIRPIDWFFKTIEDKDVMVDYLTSPVTPFSRPSRVE